MDWGMGGVEEEKKKGGWAGSEEYEYREMILIHEYLPSANSVSI